MLNAIIDALKIMGWLGIVLVILAAVNIICGTVTNVNEGEAFSWKKMLKGILKIAIFYVSAIATSVAFTMLPFINQMITDASGAVLLSDELLNTLSSVGILGVVITTIITQAKKALANIMRLAGMSSDSEKITWEVEEEIEEEE